MSDDQWAALEPLLLAAAATGRPSRSKRMLIDGIRWRVRTGAPWWDLPPCYGP
ncbi:transposase [Streptomyces mirabilis]|uniref:transposase n=1 Tax=Streptomyces mirabilis TaxID=68239 RepID=UPI003330C276